MSTLLDDLAALEKLRPMDALPAAIEFVHKHRAEIRRNAEDARFEASVLEGAIFIGGPRAHAIVYDRTHVDPTIAQLAKLSGDEEYEFTATNVPRVAAAIAQHEMEGK